ncbi:hypothetical protein [Acinetobacter haemolyticus]|uniref:hypothetical protein n=1 Tax=Acinetobacter haemolyticus TaxID=29430 RepID=UPI000D69E13C|nr:hypothetical protein [Acinetobacter haemolyticus]
MDWILRFATKLKSFLGLKQKEDHKSYNYDNPYRYIDESITVQQQCERLLELDHYDHENIIWDLQMREDSYAIPYIKEAILLKPRLEYLSYDDYGSYYKKCFWALRTIGTEEAIAVIKECAQSDNPVLRNEAEYRLKQIALGR